MAYWDFEGTVAFIVLIAAVGTYFFSYVAASAWKRVMRKD